MFSSQVLPVYFDSHYKPRSLLSLFSGYIGGAVLERFLSRPDITSYNVRALVRSPEKAEKLKTFGVDAVVGSHDDVVLVEKLASETDVFFSIVRIDLFLRPSLIISQADADHMPAAKATLAGLKSRHAATGVAPILIHTVNQLLLFRLWSNIPVVWHWCAHRQCGGTSELRHRLRRQQS